MPVDASSKEALSGTIMAKHDDERAKRLADALRANLRKRKEGQQQPHPPAPDAKTGESSS